MLFRLNILHDVNLDAFYFRRLLLFFSGLTPSEAEFYYLENASKLALYGVDLHLAKVCMSNRLCRHFHCKFTDVLILGVQKTRKAVLRILYSLQF